MPMVGKDHVVIIMARINNTSVHCQYYFYNICLILVTVSQIKSLTRFNMMLCNCIDFEFSFYYRYRVVRSVKMESDTSKGDTPGKPKNKAPRLSRNKYPGSSSALFQSLGKSPKVKKHNNTLVQLCK